MAYIVTSETAIGDPATTYDQPIPAGHQSGDLLLAIVSQDAGPTTIAASGWTQIGTQAQNQGQRTTAFYKIAASSAEADFSATGTNDDWITTIIVIRNANTATPIHQQTKADSANSTSDSLTSGTVTTTENNCLILYACGFDNTAKLVPSNPAELTYISKETSAGNVQVVGYRNQITAGAVPAITFLSEVSSEGGTALTIAISDTDPSAAQMGPDSRQTYSIVKRYGGLLTATNSERAFIRHDGISAFDNATVGLTPTTIAGLDLLDATLQFAGLQTITNLWGTMTGFTMSGSAIDTTGRWVGVSHSMSAVDFSNKIFHIEININDVNRNRFGPEGIIAVFEDSLGEWAAFTLTKRPNLLANTTYSVQIDIEGTTPLDESGSIDWTDITRIGYLFHKTTTATNAITLRVKNAILFDKTIAINGSAQAPITPVFFDNLISGWGPWIASSFQGKGQALIKQAIQYGNGTDSTYVDLSATSTEYPLGANASILRRFWQVPASSSAAGIFVNASASDTVNFTACVLASDTAQNFTINSASSSSASYDFSGASIVNYNITNNASGVTINNATLQNCLITLNGGSLDTCNIVDPRGTSHVTTNNPGNISGCSFSSAGFGHAIEITSTGTYDFFNNSFTGYGADTSTDAAIYNNSGGAVTLNLAAGDSVPTVRNGAGASTTINAAPVEITATVLADSRVELYNVTTDTQIENTFLSGTSYSYEVTSEATSGDIIRLRVCKKGYLPFETTAAYSAAGIGFVVNQVEDEIYTAYAIDGATVTKFTPDYINDQVDLNIASNFSAAEFYNWFNYNLTTENGIEDFFGGVTAIDSGNIRINNAVVNLFFDNTTTTNVFQNDNIRIFRADSAYPVANPTSGGGGIDLVWRNQVYTVNVGGSSLTPTESSQLSSINDISTKLDGLIEDSSGNRFTAKALETAGGGGASASDIADAVWEKSTASPTASSYGEFIQKLLTTAKFLGLK